MSLDIIRLTQYRNNFCNAWAEYYRLYRSVSEEQPNPEDIDLKYCEVLPRLDRCWNEIKGYLSDEWKNVDICRFLYWPYMNLEASRNFERLIEVKGLPEPYKLEEYQRVKVENYSSCNSLLGTYSYNRKDLFKCSPWDPEGYYHKVMEAATDGMFQASEYQERELKSIPKETKKKTSQQYEFSLNGEFWIITYEGETANLKNTIGLQYIHCLLKRPVIDFTPTQLVDKVSTVTPDAYRRSEEQQENKSAEDSSAGKVPDGIPFGQVLTDEAREDLLKRYKELKSDLEDDTETKYDEEIVEIKNEMKQIMKSLNASINKDGKSRSFADITERNRRSVSKAIKESLDKIKDTKNGIPALGKHFDIALKSGTSCFYKPEKPIPWHL
jgi:hypothetical protein